MILVIAGTLLAGYLIAALFFLRFWRRTGDPLFLSFFAAFLLLAVHRMALATYAEHGEPVTVYLLRLAAFVVILFAIVRKNVSPRRG